MAFEGLSEKLNATFKRLRGKGRLTEADVREGMREVRMALLEADVSYKVVKDFIKKTTERAVGADVLESLSPAQMVIKIVNEELVALMGGSEAARLNIKNKGQTIIMLCGLQGAGKTTMSAKLANWLKKDGKRPLLAACDVYRPAAITQLQVVGKQLDIPVFEMGQIDPVTIAKEAVKYAADHGHDIVFLDTAGRLHIDEALMDELKAVKAAVKPNEILLVVDAMTGQDAVNAAKAFDDALGIDGVLLTKLDGDARGGAALSIRAATGKPIKFVGTGEKLDMIEPFHPDRMASRILGMGDMLTFIEKAEQQYDEEQAKKLEEKLRKNRLTLSDYLDQLEQLQNMGDLSQIADMLPGGMAKGFDPSQIDEKQMAHNKAIIRSMTPKERENAFVKDHPVTFLMGIGGKLHSGKPHDGRAPDYDDWSLNGDILMYDPVLDSAFEISSMGIRVDEASMDYQLRKRGCDDRRELPFHKMLLSGQLPLTIGGGIGQSRLCMLMIGTCHIGEVQASLWDKATVDGCAQAGVMLL